MKWLCRLFGHKWSGVITGFRNSDGAAIGRCTRCAMPIVDLGQHAARSLKMDLDELGSRSVAELARSGVPFGEIVRSEVLRRTVVYDEDRFF